jgi:hypothetical protein
MGSRNLYREERQENPLFFTDCTDFHGKISVQSVKSVAKMRENLLNLRAP